jgi:hypothetical protein
MRQPPPPLLYLQNQQQFQQVVPQQIGVPTAAQHPQARVKPDPKATKVNFFVYF